MGEQLKDGTADRQLPKDPLRPALRSTGQVYLKQQAFILREAKTSKGTIVFQTSDREVYARLDDGSIRHSRKRIRGKAARRADKLARRKH